MWLFSARLISALASAGHLFSWRERPRGKEPCHPVKFLSVKDGSGNILLVPSH